MGVPVELLMPKFGMTMVEGLVVQWLKQAGERVEKGEPLVVIETDKVTVELEAPCAGVLDNTVAEPGEYVPCGLTIGVLLADREVGQKHLALSGKPRRKGPAQSITRGASNPALPATIEAPANVLLSPVALKIATEHGLDVTRIRGTGPEGRVMKDDVLRAIREGVSEETNGAALDVLESIPIKGIRRVISERMHQSRQTAAHFALSMEVDMTEAERLREELARRDDQPSGEKITLNDMVLHAVARSLLEHRRINCSVVEGEIRVWKQINIGVAVATDRGLIVPVIRDTERKSLAQISKVSFDLAERAREGTLDLTDVGGGTFTVTNLGALGVDSFTPIINPPESAILGVGRVVRKPVVLDSEVAVRPMMQLTLSVDHRIIDGAPAARFLGAIKERLDRPEWMKR